MSGDFQRRFEKALRLIWKSPPDGVSGQAAIKPATDPVAPPPDDSPVRTVHPKDIRSATAMPETPGSMLTRSLPGIDLTFMVTPPRGDALWMLQGRVWLNPNAPGRIRVVLVQGQNILDENLVENGGHFKFQDILVGEWHLEFHLSGNRVVVLRAPDG